MTSDRPTLPETSSLHTQRAVAPAWVIGLVLMLALTAGFGTARFLRTRGMTSVVGRLEAERVLLKSDVAGEVISCRVQLGQDVQPGDVVATIQHRRSHSRVELEKRLADVAQQEQHLEARYEFEIGSLTRQLDAEIHALSMTRASLLGDQYAAEVERVAWRDALDDGSVRAVSHEADDRVQEVFGNWKPEVLPLEPVDRFEAVIAHERAAAKADACDAQVLLCNQRLESLQHERKQLADQFRKTLGLDAVALAKERLTSELAGIDVTTELTSPTYGVAVAVAESGQECDRKTAVVELADEARRRVTAAVPADVAADLNTESEVAVVFPTGDRRTGRVAFIAPATGQSTGVGIIIEPTGKRWPDLSLGCEVTVEVR